MPSPESAAQKERQRRELRRKRAFPEQHHGLTTLETFAETPRLNRWYFDELSGPIHGEVLEIGSGIGNMSEHLARAASHLTVSDMEPDYVRALEERFAGRDDVDVVRFVLGEEIPPQIAERSFDAIVSLNVIEHVEDDLRAVSELAEHLRPGGHLLSYVPATDWAYGSIDLYLHHYRRYGVESFSALMRGAGLEVTEIHYVNLVGLAGWLLNGRVLRRTTLSNEQTKLFDLAVPIIRRLETLRPPIGLGLICHARKP